jgi:hypothetical protein
LHDRHTLLHWNHLRDGGIGGWRQEATPEQCRFLKDSYGSWLITRGYETDNTCSTPCTSGSGEIRSTWVFGAMIAIPRGYNASGGYRAA